MPNLSESSIITRENQAIQVLFLILQNPRTTIAEACASIGITEDIYRRWIQHNPDSLDAIRDFIGASQKEMLFAIETAWPVAISELISDAVSPNTSVKNRIGAIKALQTIKTELENIHHAQPGVEEAAYAFLKRGPALKSVKPRMGVEIEQTDTGIRIELTSPETLDGDFLDEDEH